jgi:hypothetical protein
VSPVRSLKRPCSALAKDSSAVSPARQAFTLQHTDDNWSKCPPGMAHRAVWSVGNGTSGDQEEGDLRPILTAQGLAHSVHQDFSQIPAFSSEHPNSSPLRGPLTVTSLPGVLQPRLAVGHVDDPFEREADRVAEWVMRMSARGFPTTSEQVGRQRVATVDESAEPLRSKQAGSVNAGNKESSHAPDIVDEVLRTPGQPLDASARAFFESRFGTDFSAVRVHSDPRAAESARSIGACAYTVGSNVVFDSAQFAPWTTAGQSLLAHELHHVVQQGAAGPHKFVQRQAASPEVATNNPAREPIAAGPAREPIAAGPAREPIAAGPAREPIAAGGPGYVSVSVGSTMTAEAGLREVYDQCARQITDEALKIAAEEGNTAEAVEKAARWAVTARNDLKVAIRSRGSVVIKALAEARNINRYGNKIGPSYDELIREGKTPPEIIGSSGQANVKWTRAATKLRLAGRLLIVLDLAMITWEVIEAPEGSRLRTVVGGAGGLAGVWAGGELGAAGGAKIGGAIGTFIEPGGGTAVGGLVGGIVGGFGGAIVGGIAGKRVSQKVYDIVDDIFAPNIDAEIERINAEQDAIIRSARK